MWFMVILTEGNFHWIFARNCEGTEQLRIKWNQNGFLVMDNNGNKCYNYHKCFLYKRQEEQMYDVRGTM